MKSKKTVWLSAFKYVVPADYEIWLEQLSMQGWNIDRIGQWSSVVMTFHRSGPKKYRYIYDAQVFPKEEYKPTYEQFGWEFVGQMASCYLWRKEYTDKRPESFTSHESLEKRNKQVFNAVSVSFIIFSLVSILSITALILTFSDLSSGELLQFILGIVLSSIFALYLGHVMRKIYKNRFE